ncbi:contactin-1a-like isoform X1 [Arapaima gigas]
MDVGKSGRCSCRPVLLKRIDSPPSQRRPRDGIAATRGASPPSTPNRRRRVRLQLLWLTQLGMLPRPSGDLRRLRGPTPALRETSLSWLMSWCKFSSAVGITGKRTMWPLASVLLALFLALPSAERAACDCSRRLPPDDSGFGPVFEEQPTDTIYPEESPEDKITMSCRARANPPATYRWRLNGWDIKLLEQEEGHYSLEDGNLVISRPDRSKHVGTYECVAQNVYGTVISREAAVKFGYLDPFSTEERDAVHVKEGQGAVLLCASPPHYPEELSFRWMFNEFPVFIPVDKRRFVSQSTGNLYISKVDSSDLGNYSCFVSSPSIAKSVFSKFISLVPIPERPPRKYPADIKVKFPDTYALAGQNITLECFALGNPIPEIRWRKVDAELPANHEVSMDKALLHLFNVQQEDEGTYECEAINSKGKDRHRAVLYVDAYPEWVEHFDSIEADIDGELTMPCRASGKPKPHIRWLKNGVAHGTGELKFSRLTFEHSGMYQCIAENKHGIIYASGELRVVACAPTFEHNPVKKRVLGAKNGQVLIECRPKAAPKARLSWSKGTELLSNTSRIHIWDDGTLEILNVTQMDEGRYTCFAENNRGKANSTGSLSITEATKITLAPSNADVQVGESTRMQCAASHDPNLDITFTWALGSHVIDFDTESDHYQRNREVSGELLIKKTQLRHAGRYTCTAQTIVDNVTASADLVVRGPPGPPGGVRVDEITEKSVRLFWSRGTDNHSPISKYTVQLRDSFSLDPDEWRDANTSPSNVEGNAEMVYVVGLTPWTEYEFRVIATNTLGTGEPSNPSPKIRTLEAVPVVAPSDVGGGGETSRELTITWTPVKPQYYYGKNFGYIVAFKSHDSYEWSQVTVADPEAQHYVHKDPTIPPNTEFLVKIKAFNNKGEGPYSLTASVFSAQDVPSEAPSGVSARALSATEAIVSWQPSLEKSIDGYRVKYWRKHEESQAGTKVVETQGENQTRLENMLPNSRYFIEVRAFNKAGMGPPSVQYEIHTKKAPPSRPPKIIRKTLSAKSVNIAWEQVEPLANESKIQGYTILYRQEGFSNGTMYTTPNRYIDLPPPKDRNYIVEVRALSEGGDGAVAQVRISGGAESVLRPLSLAALLFVAFCCLGN